MSCGESGFSAVRVPPHCQASGTDSSGPTCINHGTAQLDFVLLTALSSSAFQLMSVEARLKAKLYKNTNKMGLLPFVMG